MLKFGQISKRQSKCLIEAQAESARQIIYRLSEYHPGLVTASTRQLKEVKDLAAFVCPSPGQVPFVSLYSHENFHRNLQPSSLGIALAVIENAFGIKTCVEHFKIRQESSTQPQIVQMGLVSFTSSYLTLAGTNRIRRGLGYEFPAIVPVATMCVATYYSGIFEEGDMVPLMGIMSSDEAEYALLKCQKGWSVIKVDEGFFHVPEFEFLVQ